MKYLLLFSLSDQLSHWKGLTLTLIIGAVAGALAGLLMKNGRSLGLLFSIILGLAGSWICNSFFGDYLSLTKSHITNEIIGATAGAIVLSVIINLIFGSNKGKDRTSWRA